MEKYVDDKNQTDDYWGGGGKDIMKFKENDIVKIRKNYEGVVNKDEIGTILIVFYRPQEIYEI